MASIDDTPEWALVGTDDFLRQLTLLTGLKLRAGASDNGDAPAQPRPTPVGRDTQVEIEAVAHPLTDGVEVLRGYSDEPSELWQADPEDGDRLYLSLGRERSSGFDALWETPEGNGRIILVASGSLLTNHIVADSDAPRFIANVMRHHLAGTGAVIFDDMHQGLSVLYDPAAFFGDARLHATIVFLIAGWLVYLLGSSNRLAPPLAARTEPKQADFLGAVAGFMARRLRPRDAGLLLLEEWFDEIRRQRGLPQRPEPPWEELRATPALDRHTCDALETGYKTLKSGRAVDLVRLHNLLLQARRATG
jgi:hypothetical protein